MSKNAWRKKRGEGVAEVEVGRDHLFCGEARFLRRYSERLNNRHVEQTFTLSEGYSEGRLDLCFVLGVGEVAGRIVEPLEDQEVYVWRTRQNHLRPRYHWLCGDVAENGLRWGSCVDDGTDIGQHKQLMFVLNVDLMDEIETAVPVWLRLERANLFLDLFAGEPYTSVLKGGCKALRSVILGKEKLDYGGLIGPVLRHDEKGVVERRPEIVDGISQDEREDWRDGFVLFDKQNLLAGFALMPLPKDKWLFGKESVTLGTQIVDVIAGPL